jgi:hypothetical protein
MVARDGLVRLGSRVFSVTRAFPRTSTPTATSAGTLSSPAKSVSQRCRYQLHRRPPILRPKGNRDRFRLDDHRARAAALPVPGSYHDLGGVRALTAEHLRSRRVFTRGEGCFVWDADGHRHRPAVGLAVTALGHAHPTVLAAITGQLATLGHVSNFFATPAQVALAGRLTELTGTPGTTRVFFTNSGTRPTRPRSRSPG